MLVEEVLFGLGRRSFGLLRLLLLGLFRGLSVLVFSSIQVFLEFALPATLDGFAGILVYSNEEEGLER